MKTKIIELLKPLLGLDYPESIAIYGEANERIENYSEIIHFTVLKVTPICVIIPKALTSLLNYFTTDLGSDALVLPLPMWFVRQLIVRFIDHYHQGIYSLLFAPNCRFPFYTKNLSSYLFAVALEYASNVLVYCFIANLVSIGLGAFIFIFAMTEDIKSNFNSIDENATAKATQVNMHERVPHSIQVHFFAKQLSKIASLLLIFQRTK